MVRAQPAATQNEVPAPAVAGEVALPRLGERLRHARLLNGMRLRDLAERVGCSPSMVSKIENERVVPSLTTLHRLCTALGTSVASLLESPEPQPWTILRAGQRPLIGHAEADSAEGTQAELIVPQSPGRLLGGWIVVIEPGGHSGGMLQHRGEEAGYVIEGTLELTIDGAVHTLQAGDSFHFPSDLEHGYRNPGEVVMRAVWLNTPPSF